MKKVTKTKAKTNTGLRLRCTKECKNAKTSTGEFPEIHAQCIDRLNKRAMNKAGSKAVVNLAGSMPVAVTATSPSDTAPTNATQADAASAVSH